MSTAFWLNGCHQPNNQMLTTMFVHTSSIGDMNINAIPIVL